MTTTSAFPEAKHSDDNIWSQIQGYINAKNFNKAYSFALSKVDTFMFVRLASKTGIVLDKFNAALIENVLTKIAEIVISGDFVELLLGWIITAVDKKFKLSVGLKGALENALTGLCEDDDKMKRLDEMQLSEANRILNILKIDIHHY